MPRYRVRVIERIRSTYRPVVIDVPTSSAAKDEAEELRVHGGLTHAAEVVEGVDYDIEELP